MLTLLALQTDNTKRRHVPLKLKVGLKYFDTVVTTTDSAGTSNWYKREEGNSWRSIASQIFEPIAVPPWCKEFSLTTSKKPQHFHYTQLKRQEDLVLLRKRRKREWMMKAYHLANSGLGEEHRQNNPLVGSHHTHELLASLLADHKKSHDYAAPDAIDGGEKISDVKLLNSVRNHDSADRSSMDSYTDSKGNSENSNDLILTIPKQKIVFPHEKHHNKGSTWCGPHEGGGIELQKKPSTFDEHEFTNERRHHRPVREKDDVGDLVDWRSDMYEYSDVEVYYNKHTLSI